MCPAVRDRSLDADPLPAAGSVRHRLDDSFCEPKRRLLLAQPCTNDARDNGRHVARQQDSKSAGLCSETLASVSSAFDGKQSEIGSVPPFDNTR
jgi:hypothetical protein